MADQKLVYRFLALKKVGRQFIHREIAAVEELKCRVREVSNDLVGGGQKEATVTEKVEWMGCRRDGRGRVAQKTEEGERRKQVMNLQVKILARRERLCSPEREVGQTRCTREAEKIGGQIKSGIGSCRLDYMRKGE